MKPKEKKTAQFEPLVQIKRSSDTKDIRHITIMHQELFEMDIIKEFQTYAAKELNTELYIASSIERGWELLYDRIYWLNEEGDQKGLWPIEKFHGRFKTNDKGEDAVVNEVTIINPGAAFLPKYFDKGSLEGVLEGFAKYFQEKYNTRREEIKSD